MNSDVFCRYCNSFALNKYGKHSTHGKQKYKCKDCNKQFIFDNELINRNYPIKQFKFEDDIWDLRVLILQLDKTDKFTLSFIKIKQEWLKTIVKKHTQYSISIGNSISLLFSYNQIFNNLSLFLDKNYIQENHWADRQNILSYISYRSTKVKTSTIVNELSALKVFFELASVNQWFDVPLGIIKREDFPKLKPATSNDIPTIVFDKINSNLNCLSDRIARAWMICYFCGMRISELRLCSIDCIKQHNKGQWSITFWRKKVKDFHTLPISRELAQVIQEQQEQTKKAKGQDYKYLFPDLQKTALSDAINELINQKNIRDENGKLWHFTNHQLRDTRATYLFETGHEMAIVGKWLGHKRWGTTQKYIHVKDHTLREETAKVQAQLTNIKGESVTWESLPKTLQKNPAAHTIAIPEDHINTPIYGFCGLALDRDCPHWKACYTCRSFVARKELLPDYIKIRERLKDKQSVAEERGQTALIDQYTQQADSLDVIVHSFGGN
jgi:integrase